MMPIGHVRTALLALCFCQAVIGAEYAAAQPTPNFPQPQRLTRVNTVDGVFSPDGKSIAFASDRASRPHSYDIWVAGADGGNSHPVTADAATDETPMFSPDGTKIAYASERDGNSDIYVRNVDGTGEVRLTADPAIDIHPMWYPDGSALLFNSSRGSVNKDDPEIFDIYSVKPDGSRLRRITRHDAVSTYASLSPDGRHLLFRRLVGENSEVFVARPDGTEAVNITNHPAFDGWPMWSPDGERIVFVSSRAGAEGSEIFLMNADGTGLAQLTRDGLRSFAPSFSPDGKTIIYTRAGGGITDLFLLAVPDAE